jgi:hypothetical protein
MMLPKGLIGIPSQDRWAMYLDIGHPGAGAEVMCVRDIARAFRRLIFVLPYRTHGDDKQEQEAA